MKKPRARVGLDLGQACAGLGKNSSALRTIPDGGYALTEPLAGPGGVFPLLTSLLAPPGLPLPPLDMPVPPPPAANAKPVDDAGLPASVINISICTALRFACLSRTSPARPSDVDMLDGHFLLAAHPRGEARRSGRAARYDRGQGANFARKSRARPSWHSVAGQGRTPLAKGGFLAYGLLPVRPSLDATLSLVCRLPNISGLPR
jgi:hypothetical protein